MKQRCRRLWAVALSLCLALSAWGLAEEAAPAWEVSENGLTLGESSLRYPVLSGPEPLSGEVNERLQADGHVAEELTRMSQLLSGGSLTVDWAGGLLGTDVFSAVFSAEGALETLRPTHAWRWSNLDLRDGHEILFGEIFDQEENARVTLEELLEWEVAPELSAHLLNSQLTPLPEGFFLERTGITLLYDIDALSTLSDRAGAVKIPWHALREYLAAGEDGIPARIGAWEMITLTEDSAERIREMTEAGQLPDIPAVIGDSLQEWTDRQGLLIDPDVYEGGRMFSLEGAAFRNVYLLTDFLSERWDQSVVQGIRMDGGCAWGLCVGETRREDWRKALGDPDSQVTYDAERAELWRVREGSCDYYTFGAHQLRLFSDEDGILTHIVLME